MNCFDDVSDLDYLFMRMQVLLGIELHERDSVIVFDEVNIAPRPGKPLNIWWRMADMIILKPVH